MLLTPCFNVGSRIGANSMDNATDTSTTTFCEPDEDLLTCTVSDEAIEAAADGDGATNEITNSFIVWSDPCCH